MASHIFTTIEEIAEHYPFLETLEFNRIKPSVKFVERRYIPELMDSVTFGTLLDEIDDIPAASAQWKELIDRTRDACAYLVALYAIPHLNVGIGEMGLRVEVTDMHQPASKDRKNDLMRGIWEQATDHLDLVIDYLNANIATFTDYASSDQYAANTKSLINDASTFNELYAIGTNRWVWRMLRPWRNRAEESRIIGTLGKEYHAELITQAKAGSLTAENKAIYTLAQQALAFATIEISALHLQLRFEEGGVTIYNNASQPVNDLRTSAEIERVNLAVKKCQQQARSILSRIEKELRSNASASKYTTFFNSPAYVAPSEAVKLNDVTDPDHSPGTFNAL
jgi:hypothetical protein